MNGKFAFIAVALLVSQCAAATYNLPEPGRSEVEEAQADIDRAVEPVKSDRSLDDLISETARTAEALRSVMAPFCAHIKSPSCNFRYRIVGGPGANAFVDQQGLVSITVDLLRYLDDEDEIAAVLAHEISHRLNGDDVVKMSTMSQHQAMRYVLGGSSPSSSASRNAGSSRYLISREAAADYLAAYLLSDAGYDLNKAGSMWMKLAKVSDRKAQSILATHPFSAERLATWRKVVAEIESNPGRMPALKE